MEESQNKQGMIQEFIESVKNKIFCMTLELLKDKIAGSFCQ